MKKQNMHNNGFIGPMQESIPKISQDFANVGETFTTNAAMFKNYVKNSKQEQFNEFKNRVKDFKESTVSNVESIGTTTANELRDANKSLSKIGKTTMKKSSKFFLDSKDYVDSNIPKATKGISKSLKFIFKRKNSIEKNIEILTRFAALKQQGIITTKEFNSMKKKILKSIEEKI